MRKIWRGVLEFWLADVPPSHLLHQLQHTSAVGP